MFPFTSAALYFGASFFLSKNPQFLWKQYVHPGKMMNDAINARGSKILHISHRGGSFENFENTEQAFHNAVENCQTDVIETDVCLTKDGQVVCFHDTNIKRLCGKDQYFEELNLNEIQYLKEIELDFSVSQTLKVKEGQEAKPFLLETLFEKYPNTHINLELKTKNPKIIGIVEDLIIKHNRKNITQWGSFDHSFTKKIQSHNKSMVRFLSSTEFLFYTFAHMIGLLPFLKIDGHIFQIPFYTEEFHIQTLQRTEKTFFKQFLAKMTFSILKSVQPFLPGMNEHLNKRGILVYYWVLNNQRDFERCIKSNPNGIITDTPTLLKQFLQEKNLSFEKLNVDISGIQLQKM